MVSVLHTFHLLAEETSRMALPRTADVVPEAVDHVDDDGTTPVVEKMRSKRPAESEAGCSLEDDRQVKHARPDGENDAAHANPAAAEDTSIKLDNADAEISADAETTAASQVYPCPLILICQSSPETKFACKKYGNELIFIALKIPFSFYHSPRCARGTCS